MASETREQADLAKIRAQELMDVNNSAASDTSDKLADILNAGQGSSIARELLDHYLHNYVTTRITSTRLNALDYKWEDFRKLLNINEKIAAIAGFMYASDGLNQNPKIGLKKSNNIEDDRLRITLNNIINHLEKDMMNNRDFNESRTLRNAALKNFECKLSDTETIRLNTLGNTMKALCVKNGLDSLAESTNRTHGSDAQKILKFSDIIIQLSAMGVTLDPKLIKDFEPFNEKIKPLRDLDKHYKHMTKTLNMIHRIAQKGYHSMVRPSQKTKLDTVLQKLDMLKTVNSALDKFNNIDVFDDNTEHCFLDDLIETITKHPKFQETIYNMSITEAEFNERFYSSSAFLITNVAKKGLHKQKGLAFGDRLKTFEADVQTRRGICRKRIFDIADRMTTGGDFKSDKDFDMANSYFNKFKDLFYAKEEDNYGDTAANTKTATNLHFHKIEKVLSAIIRRRCGYLVCGHRIRRGSSKRILRRYIKEGLKGGNRGFWDWMKRGRHKADDATILSMIVMAQNETTNQMLYQDEDKTKKADGKRGKIMSKISFVENYRKSANTRLKPKMDKTIAVVESTAVQAAKLSKGLLKVTNKVVSKTGKIVTKNVGVNLEKFNDMMEKKRLRGLKLPLYVPYIFTKAFAPLMKQGYKIASYTDANGNQKLDELGQGINKGYDTAKDIAGKAMGQKPEYLLQTATRATKEAATAAAQGISRAGQVGYDAIKTGQDRSLLGSLYVAAKKEKSLADMMASAELGDILNLKISGPRMFDQDGRVVTTEQVEVKEKDSPEEAGKELANQIDKQMATLSGQIDEEIRKAQKEVERTIRENDDNQRLQANADMQNKRTLKQNVNGIKIGISSLLPILRDVMRGGNWRNVDINNRIGVLAGGVYPAGTIRDILNGLITGIDIGGAGGLQERVNTTFTALNLRKREAEQWGEQITNLQSGLSARGADTAALTAQITTARGRQATAINAESAANLAYNEALVNLKNAQQRLGLFETIDQAMERIVTLNDNMHAAADDKARKQIAKEIFELAKTLDFLLYPIEEKKDTDIISMKGVSEAKRKEIDEILNAAA